FVFVSFFSFGKIVLRRANCFRRQRQRTLHRVLQLAERLLRLDQRVQLALRASGVFGLGVGQGQRLRLARLRLRVDGTQLLLQIFQQCFRRCRFFQRRVVTSQRAVNFSDGGGLHRQKMRGGGGAIRLRLGNRALVVIQNRQIQRNAERPFVVRLIQFVAGAEVEVGILLGDFKLERGLAGGVISQRAPHVGAVQNRVAPDFWRGQ